MQKATKVKVGELYLNAVQHGEGPITVLFVHGNLGCVDWMDLVWPLLDDRFRVIAVEWRGCGESDKPLPLPDYSNYSMETHAQDMLGALDALGIDFCHLANHSTGGIICSHMQLLAPERFGKVLSLDPVTPASMEMGPPLLEVFRQMKASPDMARAVMAGATPTLFNRESLIPGYAPTFRDRTRPAQRDVFDRIVARLAVLSDGIWFGTPINLTKEHDTHPFAGQLDKLSHEQLVLWGAEDVWISLEAVQAMTKELPNCRLVVEPDVGHSMNVEDPARYANHFNTFLG